MYWDAHPTGGEAVPLEHLLEPYQALSIPDEDDDDHA